MYQIAKPLFLICETPLHAGSGSDLGIVDLPIQRERHTSFPKIEGSSLKGALREAAEYHILKDLKKDVEGNFTNKPTIKEKLKKLNIVFGHDKGAVTGFPEKEMKDLFDSEETFSSAIGFTDARLLLFPIKSMKGVFAWVTCKKVLSRFASDQKQCQKDFDMEGLSLIDKEKTYVFNTNTSTKLKTNKIVLEEYTFTIENDLNGAVQIIEGETKTNLSEWLAQHIFNNDGSYWCEKIKKDIIVLPDDDFTDFVNLSTEVITRTKISNETGTVEAGALFTEEYLPAESILYSLTLAHRPLNTETNLKNAQDVSAFFIKHIDEVVQIGGSATIGKGLVRTGKSFFKTENA